MTAVMSHTEAASADRNERRFGWRGRCQNCGAGAMLHTCRKVRDHCPVRSAALPHQCADDGPAYLTILIVGPVLAPLLYAVFVRYRPEPLVLAAMFTTLTMALYPLPRMKEAPLARQWAKGIHGFGVPLGPDHG